LSVALSVSSVSTPLTTTTTNIKMNKLANSFCLLFVMCLCVGCKEEKHIEPFNLYFLPLRCSSEIELRNYSPSSMNSPELKPYIIRFLRKKTPGTRFENGHFKMYFNMTNPRISVHMEPPAAVTHKHTRHTRNTRHATHDTRDVPHHSAYILLSFH